MLQLNLTRLATPIYETLKQRILSLKLKPGSFIFESEIAQEFQVSRTPVRQVISSLEFEGFVKVHSQRGIQVAELSISQIEDMQELREALELYSISKVADSWAKSSTVYAQRQSEIEENIRLQARSLETGELLTFAQLDREFHIMLVRALDNVVLSRAHERAMNHLARLRVIELIEMDHGVPGVSEHERIAQAVFSNQPDVAVHEMRKHLRRLDEIRDDIIARNAELFTS